MPKPLFLIPTLGQTPYVLRHGLRLWSPRHGWGEIIRVATQPQPGNVTPLHIYYPHLYSGVRSIFGGPDPRDRDIIKYSAAGIETDTADTKPTLYWDNPYQATSPITPTPERNSNGFVELETIEPGDLVNVPAAWDTYTYIQSLNHSTYSALLQKARTGAYYSLHRNGRSLDPANPDIAKQEQHHEPEA